MDAVNITRRALRDAKDRLIFISAIRSELRERLDVLNGEGKLLEAQRLEQHCHDRSWDRWLLQWGEMPVIWRVGGGTPGVSD